MLYLFVLSDPSSCIIRCVFGSLQIALYSMFVSAMAFFARVSDPLIGGTYMTLLNTLSNLGNHNFNYGNLH